MAIMTETASVDAPEITIEEQSEDEAEKKLKKRMRHMKRLIYLGFGGNAGICTPSSEIMVKETPSKRREFKNIDVFCDSPNAISPVMASHKLEDLEFDFRATEGINPYSGFHLLKQIAVVAAAAVRVPVLVNVVCCYCKYGGMAFLLLLYVSLFLVAVPVAVIELSLGQYTSLPPYSLFSRMSKATVGVGLLMVAFRVVIQVHEMYDSRPMHYMMETFGRMVGSDNHWMDCRQYGDPFCTIIPNTTDLRWEKYPSTSENRVWDAMTRTEDLTVLPTELFQYLLIYTDIRRLACMILTTALAGLLIAQGVQTFVRFTMAVVVAVYAMLFIPILVTAICNPDVALEVMFFDSSYLLNIEAMFFAISTSMQLLCVGDGTWIVIGTRSSFHDDIIAPVVVVAVISVLCTYAFTTTGLVLYAENLVDISIPEMFVLFKRRRHNEWLNLEFLKIPVITGYDLTIIMNFLTNTIAGVPYLVLTVEVLVQTIYRIVPELYRLSHVVAVTCIVNTTMSLIVLAKQTIPLKYTFNVDINSTLKLVGMFSIINAEVMMVMFFYRDKRLLVNLRAMFGKNPKRVRHKIERFYSIVMQNLKFLWRYIFSSCILMSLILTIHAKADLYNRMTVSGISVFVTAAILICWLIAACVATKYLVRGRPMEIFRPHTKWGPANVNARMKGNRIERAARALT